MERKGIIGLAVLLLLLVVIGAVVYQVVLDDNTKKDDDISLGEPHTLTEENFVFEYTYKGDNLWSYTVKGNLPTPCYSINTDAVVMESFPEQVIVTSRITPPAKDVMCAQVIQEVNEVGEFNASEKAQVTFKVEN